MPNRAPARSTWTTKEGEVIKIRDLTDLHLINIIKMLIRNADKVLEREVSAAWSFLCSVQGEMAEYYIEQDINRLENTSPIDFLNTRDDFRDLMAEAKYRNLLPEIDT